MNRIRLMICVPALLLLPAATIAQNTAVGWWALDGGGCCGFAANVSITSVLGQPAVGVGCAGNTMICGGFLATRSGGVTSVHPEAPQIPLTCELRQNYPNPFNPTTVIGYEVPVVSAVSLRVYDLLGREVAILINEVEAPGTHSVTFNASGLASGVYLYRIEAGSPSTPKGQAPKGQAGSGRGFVQTKKLVLLK